MKIKLSNIDARNRNAATALRPFPCHAERPPLLSAYARHLAAEYEELELPVPEWLEKSTDTLREEIARRTRAADLANLKDLEREIESLKTASERRADASKRMAALQKKLGLSTAKA